MAPDLYAVHPLRLFAGAYPGGDDGLLDRLDVLRVIDLTEARELPPYATTAEHVRVPIRDGSTPDTAAVRRVLKLLDDEVPTYLHCRAGRGRTGTIVACHLGGGDEALAALRELRRSCASADLPSPETAGQIALVRAWPGSGG